MKISKQKNIDYEKTGYGGADGWEAMYDWDKMSKTIRRGSIILAIISSLTLIILFRFVFDLKSMYPSASDRRLRVLLSLLAYIFIVTPIHEILHLAAHSPNIFSKKCTIFIGFTTFSAFYDGEVSRDRELFALILPVISISFASTCLGIFAKNYLPWLSLIFILNVIGSWTDIHMSFYLLKKFPKNTLVYGNRYKIL